MKKRSNKLYKCVAIPLLNFHHVYQNNIDIFQVKCLVQQILVLESWRDEVNIELFILYQIIIILQVFPRMMKIGSPKSSFPVYSLLFQEACALSLLETCIFHVDVAENLEDAGTDLLDYCVR